MRLDHTLARGTRTVPGIMDSLGVVDGVLGVKRTVCQLSMSRGGPMLSVHSAEPAYSTMLLSELPMSS